MEDAAVLAILLGTIFGVIFTTYFVKIARRLTKLIDALRYESEHRTKLLE
jgi:hypothetical protein